MAELPILPLKTDALLADTAHMTAEEFGCYCRILFTMWRHGARLPDNTAQLARIAGVSIHKWKRLVRVVIQPLIVSGGLISQKRLSTTWSDVQEIRRKKAMAAQKRWSGHAPAYAPGHASASPNGYAPDVHPDVRCNANQNQNHLSLSSLEEAPEKSVFRDHLTLPPENPNAKPLAVPIAALTREELEEAQRRRKAVQAAEVAAKVASQKKSGDPK